MQLLISDDFTMRKGPHSQAKYSVGNAPNRNFITANSEQVTAQQKDARIQEFTSVLMRKSGLSVGGITPLLEVYEALKSSELPQIKPYLYKKESYQARLLGQESWQEWCENESNLCRVLSNFSDYVETGNRLEMFLSRLNPDLIEKACDEARHVIETLPRNTPRRLQEDSNQLRKIKSQASWVSIKSVTTEPSQAPTFAPTYSPYFGNLQCSKITNYNIYRPLTDCRPFAFFAAFSNEELTQLMNEKMPRLLNGTSDVANSCQPLSYNGDPSCEYLWEGTEYCLLSSTFKNIFRTYFPQRTIADSSRAMLIFEYLHSVAVTDGLNELNLCNTTQMETIFGREAGEPLPGYAKSAEIYDSLDTLRQFFNESVRANYVAIKTEEDARIEGETALSKQVESLSANITLTSTSLSYSMTTLLNTFLNITQLMEASFLNITQHMEASFEEDYTTLSKSFWLSLSDLNSTIRLYVNQTVLPILDQMNSLSEDLDQTTLERIKNDTLLWDALTNETQTRKAKDEALTERIEALRKNITDTTDGIQASVKQDMIELVDMFTNTTQMIETVVSQRHNTTLALLFNESSARSEEDAAIRSYFEGKLTQLKEEFLTNVGTKMTEILETSSGTADILSALKSSVQTSLTLLFNSTAWLTNTTLSLSSALPAEQQQRKDADKKETTWRMANDTHLQTQLHDLTSDLNQTKVEFTQNIVSRMAATLQNSENVVLFMETFQTTVLGLIQTIEDTISTIQKSITSIWGSIDELGEDVETLRNDTSQADAVIRKYLRGNVSALENMDASILEETSKSDAAIRNSLRGNASAIIGLEGIFSEETQSIREDLQSNVTLFRELFRNQSLRIEALEKENEVLKRNVSNLSVRLTQEASTRNSSITALTKTVQAQQVEIKSLRKDLDGFKSAGNSNITYKLLPADVADAVESKKGAIDALNEDTIEALEKAKVYEMRQAADLVFGAEQLVQIMGVLIGVWVMFNHVRYYFMKERQELDALRQGLIGPLGPQFDQYIRRVQESILKWDSNSKDSERLLTDLVEIQELKQDSVGCFSEIKALYQVNEKLKHLQKRVLLRALSNDVPDDNQENASQAYNAYMQWKQPSDQRVLICSVLKDCTSDTDSDTFSTLLGPEAWSTREQIRDKITEKWKDFSKTLNASPSSLSSVSYLKLKIQVREDVFPYFFHHLNKLHFFLSLINTYPTLINDLYHQLPGSVSNEALKTQINKIAIYHQSTLKYNDLKEIAEKSPILVEQFQVLYKNIEKNKWGLFSRAVTPDSQKKEAKVLLELVNEMDNCISTLSSILEKGYALIKVWMDHYKDIASVSDKELENMLKETYSKANQISENKAVFQRKYKEIVDSISTAPGLKKIPELTRLQRDIWDAQSRSIQTRQEPTPQTSQELISLHHAGNSLIAKRGARVAPIKQASQRDPEPATIQSQGIVTSAQKGASNKVAPVPIQVCLNNYMRQNLSNAPSRSDDENSEETDLSQFTFDSNKGMFVLRTSHVKNAHDLSRSSSLSSLST